MLYTELKELIRQKNEEYKAHNDAINNATSENELQELRVRKYQFTKQYAQDMHDYIWEHLTELTPKDCTAFDLIPYSVWSSLSGRYALIVEQIKALHTKGETPSTSNT